MQVRCYAVLVFPDQVLSHDRHIAFAQRFGPIDRSMIVEVGGAKLRVPGEIADVSNLDSKGQILAPDNRCTMHRGRPFDDQRWKRDAQRATVEDVANTLEQEGVRVQAVG